MSRGLLIPPNALPEVIEAADWFALDTLQATLELESRTVVSVELPTPRRYRPVLKLFFGKPADTVALNTTATAMAGDRIGHHGPIRGRALVLVRKRDEFADMALDDMFTLAIAVATAELGLPAPK